MKTKAVNLVLIALLVLVISVNAEEAIEIREKVIKVIVKTSGHDTTPPTAEAGSDKTVNVGESVSFYGGASWDNVGIVSYFWDFGDGTTGTGITTTHTYTEVGTYTVTLTVKDAAGNSANDSLTVKVKRRGGLGQGAKESLIEIKDGTAKPTASRIANVVPEIKIPDARDGYAAITVDVQTTKPTGVKDLGVQVFKYLIITPRSEDRNKSGTIYFQVEESEIANATLDKEDIALYRFHNDNWIELPTETVTGAPTGYVRYKADTPGFSWFAIAGKGVALPPVVKIPNPFILNLQAGWNLISLPLVPVDENGTEITNLTQILAGLSGGSVERILTYNAETQLWSEYPNGSIPLTNMTAGKGYFLKMKESANLTLKGVEIYNNMPRSYTLYEGWNLIGYHSESTIPVEKALNSIDGNYSSLWMLDNGEWKSYIAGDFWSMQPGKGYWIYMNSKGVIPQV